MKKKSIGIVLTAIIFLSFGFVSASRVTEIVEYHFQLSSIYWVKTNIPDTQNITTNIWYLLTQSDKYLKENMATLLNDESTRRSNLNTYISDWSRLLNALWYQKNRLNNQLQNSASKIQSCQNQLTAANQKYLTSLNNRNEMGFNQSVANAKAARNCIVEEQVNQSAAKSLLNQVQNYTDRITRRNTYLKNNQTLILRHYDILKPSLLRELYPISIELES